MKAKRTKVNRSPAVGIGEHIRGLILKNKDNQAILDSVLKKFPTAKTRLPNVAWYRNKMRTDGVKGVKTNRQLAA